MAGGISVGGSASISDPTSVTRKQNKIMPNIWKKVAQNTTTSTSKLN
jgi:hypothetical protein